MIKAGNCDFCGRIVLKPCKRKLDKGCILEVYMDGFVDELSQKKFTSYIDPILDKAYRLGKQHAIIGDDLTAVDYYTDELILEMILDKKK